VRAPERLWSVPLDGDEVGALVVDDRGDVGVSTSRVRAEARPGGFDCREGTSVDTSRGVIHRNVYAHRSYAIDAGGRVIWEHPKLRIARAIPGGWAALTDRHDLVVINRGGVTTRRRRLEGDTWRICGWEAGEPVVSSDPGATWVDPYVYRVCDRQLQRASETGRPLGAVDLPRAPFDDECRRDPPPAGLPHLFPHQLNLIAGRDRRSLIATHRSIMAWIASITLDGELSWVHLIDHACCNSACVAGDRVLHTSACGSKITLLASDGRVLASRQARALDAVPDGRGGWCVRAIDGVRGFDENLQPTWSLATDGIPHVTARDGVIYVAAGQGALGLSTYALDW